MADSFWYPSVRDILEIHDDIVAEYPNTSPGVRRRGDLEFAVDYIKDGSFGSASETIHEKAFHLVRLIVANHPFVDGNKRTALNTVTVFFLLNGYRFDYDDEIRRILKGFGTDEAAVREERVLEYLRENTQEIDLEMAISEWRDELVQYGLDQLTDESADPNG